jgi:hypothetical protein
VITDKSPEIRRQPPPQGAPGLVLADSQHKVAGRSALQWPWRIRQGLAGGTALGDAGTPRNFDDFIFRPPLISPRSVTIMPRASWNAN